MVAGTSCRHAGKVLRDAGNFLYGYSTGAVKLAGMPASCRHLNRERIALERFLLAGMRWISKFAGSGFAGMPVTPLAVDAKKKDFCMEKHKKAVDCKNGEK